jgi:DNA-binding IclR family transcriptional regulator
MRAAGATLKRIAAALGVSATHVHRLTKGVASYRYKFLEYNGERRTLRQWASLVGISYCALQQRVLSGWTIERAITEPLRHRRMAPR